MRMPDMCVRERIEQQERLILCDKAAFSSLSRGRERDEEKCPFRTEFQRDRDRILHCNSFRRLKHKTQVYIAPEGDHYRTRLTHTLEVAQIARTIARALSFNEDLTEAISLGHDLGHTPFGHAGERALDSVINGGFRHFEQSLRVVEKLEKNGIGLNLTWEVRNGILCHTRGEEAQTAEGRIVRLADHIAYMNHDIEDSIHAGVLAEDDLPDKAHDILGRGSSRRITTMICSVIDNSADGIIRMSPEVQEAYDILLDFLFENLYRNPIVKSEESKAEQMIKYLFEYYLLEPDRLPDTYQEIMEQEGLERAAADYISGMSDRYAVNLYMSLTVPRSWEVL